MRRNRWLAICLIASAVAFDTGQALGAEVCAGGSKALHSVTVFDGPPSEQASLVPDFANRGASSWELGYVYDAGRTVWIRCQFADGTNSEAELGARVGKCESKTIKKDVIKLACQ
jgi:hypothetical protein